MSTVDYYDGHAKEFFNSTVSLDMSAFYAPFLERLPPKAAILDAGCGSGRDALHFQRLGHDVTAFDASPELVKLASELTGRPVACLRFEDVAYSAAFDGVWACASLLHLGGGDLQGALRLLCNSLRPGGTMYASFKRGSGINEVGGRTFYLQTKESLDLLIRGVGDLDVIRQWITEDVRKDRSEKWVNVLLRRGTTN